MKGMHMGLAALASIFAGLASSMQAAGAATREFGQTYQWVTKKRRHKARKDAQKAARQAAYKAARQGDSGSKLARKAAEGRLGLTHPTRGTMATPKGLRPFSSRGLPPLTPLLTPPSGIRQWKKTQRALGNRSTPNCNVLQ